jgi:hypothetical protein
MLSKGIPLMNPEAVATTLAAGIRDVATRPSTHTEEDLRIGVEELLKRALAELGVDSSPRYEKSYAPHGSILRGRSDAVYGHLVIEYERVGTLARRRGLEHAAKQLEEYLRAEAHHAGEPEGLRRAVGVGLDGERIFFLRCRPSGRSTDSDAATVRQASLFPDLVPTVAQAPNTSFRIDGPYPVPVESIQNFLLYLRALRRRPLTPEALADEFGPTGSIARSLVASFYEALQKSSGHPKIETFLHEWDRLFGIVYGQDLTKAEADAKVLGEIYSLSPTAQLKPLLFAVHSYYALLMKLLAAELVSLQGGSFMSSPLADLPSISEAALREKLEDVENGGLFARLGVRNFLEGDFFGWYLAVWNPSLAQSIRALARALSEFEPATGSLEPDATRDLLKKLYQ